ncbi:antitoxin component YwqK of YwqJK toxin-antitoxin module [Anaerobacterium chartisolvens]|uniref:Antitoxin component YwqK of YwqJK toxin-antitoxin module n=1 Tax=Anaerobacterium chartisolvens TaxID=1297424 RepID=A0A369AV96_9FIRM|nr:hypothetical protein [Anaerobacterium chartisolvens]RCX11384.1 antitoxin component YwqK of YwqJK toxin-antitoxin module [Anaerobacterium chartisolvens]
MQDNLFKYILDRAKHTLLLPVYNCIYKLKKSSDLKTLSSKALAHISSGLKGLLSLRPQKSADYFYIGRLGVYKKLLVILLLLICMLPVAYLQFFSSPVSAPSQDLTQYEMFYNDPELEAFSGNAKILSADKAVVYDGSIEKGVCTGKGTLYDLNGSLVYSGDFKDNEYSGTGRMFYPSGKLMYHGSFEANLYNGEGILYNANSTILYSGGFLNGKKHGTGKLYDSSGLKLVYEGGFFEDLYGGDGLLYNNDKKVIYQGGFSNGKRHGTGRLYDSSGLKLVYEGGFFEDSYSDQGTLYNENGSVQYQGSFKNGGFFGEGTLFDFGTTRPIYKGQFKDSLFDGSGSLHSLSGRVIFTGPFLKGFPDYVYFLGSSSQELSKYFSDAPDITHLSSGTHLSYRDMNVSFILDGEFTEEASGPKIISAVVYNGSLPPSLEGTVSPSDRQALLGDAVYSGYTDMLSEDLTALYSLHSRGVIDNEYVRGVYSEELNMELYIECYTCQGFSLTLFFDGNGGKFLYYRWDIY